MSNEIKDETILNLIKIYDLICSLRDRLIARGVKPRYLTMHPTVWKIFEEVGFEKRFSTLKAVLEVDIREDCDPDSIYVTQRRIDEGDNDMWFGATGEIT